MKRLLSTILCFLLIGTVLPACSAEGPDSYHDNGIAVMNGYIYNITVETEPSDFLNANKDFVSVSSNGEYIATGDTVTDNDGNEYTAVIYGDINPDGKITVNDYALAKRYYLGSYQLSGAEEEASRTGEIITAMDYAKIKRHYLETYDIKSTVHRVFKTNGNGLKIAYIPLDNRPVNKDRVEYLVAASGFELLIPDEDLYRTALDNMQPNSDGSTIGNRKELLKWLKSVENECDYFVISLDQMFSGGLVGSRWLSNTDLTLETEIADYLIKLAETKHVVLFDTVMRLASTVGYEGYEMNEYNAFRDYAAMARKQLSGSQLTVENIVAGYRYGADGKQLKIDVSSEKLDQYLASRERKLRVIDYLLTHASDDIEKLYVGIDDSSPQITIQTNEINYITSLAGDNLTLFAGADELGLLGVAAVVSEVYGKAQCNVTYFGEGKDWAADSFDNDTLANNVEKHLAAIDATVTSDDSDALQILVLTQSSDLNNAASKLIKQLEANLKENIPTCVIDASNGQKLAEMIVKSNCDIAKLLGYSNWNTVGNAIGIAISNAVGRYLYIYRSSEVTEESNIGFLQTLTFSLIKDISYKRKGISSLTDNSAYGPATIVKKINASEILIGKNETASHNNVRVSNFRLPWLRAFEATFDITVK